MEEAVDLSQDRIHDDDNGGDDDEFQIGVSAIV